MTSSSSATDGRTPPGPGRLTISAFARTVGLTPSALRFYDDAGLLAPAVVDQRNGYRYYDDDQRRRAILVRQMRELDVPLTTMRTVLDGTSAQAERLLNEHVDRLSDRADRARAELVDILAALRGVGPTTTGTTTFTVGGAELAGAIRQVAPFAATAETDADGLLLDCLLLDVSDGELTVVGTDRYRLGARTLRLADLDGPDRRLPVEAAVLTGLIDWLRRRQRVRLTAAAEQLTVAPEVDHDHDTDRVDPDHDHRIHDHRIHDHRDGSEPPDGEDQQRLTIAADRFPDYRRVLGSTAKLPSQHRMITDRIRLLELISADQTSTVVLEPVADQILVSRVNDPEVRRLPAVCSGTPHRVAFSPALLASALQSSVGPDVLIETAPLKPAVVRSADEGSFSTLVMPRRLDEEPDRDAGRR